MNKKPNETAEQAIARLQLEMKQAVDALATENAAKYNKIKEFVNTLPKELGVASLEDVRNLIKQVEKGTLGAVADTSARSRTVLNAEQKTKLLAEFKTGGEENQRSKLIERYNISASTLQNMLKEAGLTTSRSPATDTAPAAPAANPAPAAS